MAAPRAPVLLGLLRHGATAWNAEHRLQGRADQPLTAAAQAWLQARTLPARPAFSRIVSSPLLRARQTAAALRLPAEIEGALVEMDWGGYEGRTVAELRAAHGAAFAADEDRGLDLQPPGGESPRAVQRRLLPWLASLDRPTLAVTHKGVIRALLALAHGWPMLGRPPARLDWGCLHLMLVADGRPRPWCYNRPLPRRKADAAGAVEAEAMR